MNAKQVWQAALGELQLKVPGPSFQTWLRTTTISEVRDGAVVIAVPSNFAREWLEKRFTRVIAETLRNVLGREVEVCFEVKAPPRGESGRARRPWQACRAPPACPTPTPLRLRISAPRVAPRTTPMPHLPDRDARSQ